MIGPDVLSLTPDGDLSLAEVAYFLGWRLSRAGVAAVWRLLRQASDCADVPAGLTRCRVTRAGGFALVAAQDGPRVLAELRGLLDHWRPPARAGGR